MVNPRKAYPVDPGLIPPYERTGRGNLGYALEAVIFLELERRGYECGYVSTAEGWEVDFLATGPDASSLLVQVCLEAQDRTTFDREVRALEAATREYPEASPILITMDSTPPTNSLPTTVVWRPAAAWLLEQ
jgi:predicted AAA+ superfamily ATPase